MVGHLEGGEYWIYLRKSRADLEAEARGDGETLAKHKKALLKLAKDYMISITEVFEEIASGESIIHRDAMLKMLNLLEEKKPKGVLVMDLDRLGRGNMQEQGLILETFRTANTKIITPRKIYDLNNEFDEEYSEFEAFMARKELKIITRRLQSGRIRSVEEGNYIGTRPPYGYNIFYDEKGSRYLVPNEEQANTVKMIFDWYTHQAPEKRIGSRKIANNLNQLQIPSYTGKQWDASTIINILKNAVYIGKIQWKKKKTKKSTEPGKRRSVASLPKTEWITVNGKHDPIIDEHVYNKAQEILAGKYHIPYHLENGKPKISTSLAGLVKCGKCGATMVYRPYTGQAAHLICTTKSCNNKSARYEYVENRLLQALDKWLHDLQVKLEDTDHISENHELEYKKGALISLEREMKELASQKEKLFDLLERGIYDEATFLERSKRISERISETNEAILQTKQLIEHENNLIETQEKIIPEVQTVVSLIKRTEDPLKKNSLLKKIISHAVYTKEQHQQGNAFSLVLLPRI
ncbi:recombinase family protein [Brevibacillus sp. M2.1A]|uniref:recombinase family protein n=1 Tax=Brevibacillus sp. M2.1A TaxID=2738980 RepID=UPI00156B6F51|nr:recombinase family protein [Brevibacillus sp. M2.1A]MCC8435426.1 recombinase family protein [Brevibacillus sp. M2.1A]